MEFLVEFEIAIPGDAPASEVKDRENAEAAAATNLAEGGYLLRLWRPHVEPGRNKVLGLYRANSQMELEALLDALPLSGWMRVAITALDHHPNDPAGHGGA